MHSNPFEYLIEHHNYVFKIASHLSVPVPCITISLSGRNFGLGKLSLAFSSSGRGSLSDEMRLWFAVFRPFPPPGDWATHCSISLSLPSRGKCRKFRASQRPPPGRAKSEIRKQTEKVSPVEDRIPTFPCLHSIPREGALRVERRPKPNARCKVSARSRTLRANGGEQTGERRSRGKRKRKESAGRYCESLWLLI